MSDRLRLKGRFIKKKVLDKRIKIIAARHRSKNDPSESSTSNSNLCQGSRIVDLEVLSRNLKCCSCKEPIFLEDTVSEKRLGLNSIFTVNCKKCCIHTQVSSGKHHVTNDTSKHSDVNTKAVLDAVHSGIGCTGLNKVLASLDIPTISKNLYKRYEREVGPAIEEAAKDSCKKAAQEERRLVTQNIDKICEMLPQEIVEEIYPHHKTLISTMNICDANNNRTVDKESFDASLGEIVNIVVSYDMGWSKRGNGRSYDSLNGYGTIIGFFSGKILDYAERIRKCAKCDLGISRDDHDCRKNLYGSAKAMEADAGAALINSSNILKETNLAVRVVIGDDDSSTMAAVRRGNVNEVFKLFDRNHLQKNFSKELYKLNNYKEMTKETITHLKKCFGYALAQNAGNSKGLATTLRSIPDHMFNYHENCGAWCHRQNGLEKQKIILKDCGLQNQLSALFNKYANNANKFSVTASSQSNEAFNNIMAHKAQKNNCYSRSESSSYRLASAVCTKNDGECHLLEVKKKLQLSPGHYTSSYVKRLDKLRLQRTIKAKLPFAKKRRNLLTQKRENLRKKNENSEGEQYKSNCGLSGENEDICNSYDSQLQELEELLISADTCNLVYFDSETSGFHKYDEILQIAAKCKDREFNIYINPTRIISDQASVHTGLKNMNGELFLRDKKVSSIPLRDALEAFQEFLNLSSKPCLLVAHNVNFDKSHLLRAILKCSMISKFKQIAGFSDSIPLFKTYLPSTTPVTYKLSELAKRHLKKNSSENFHEALYDVEILEKLVLLTDKNYLFNNAKSYIQCLNHMNNLKITATAVHFLSPLKGTISDHMIKKIALSGIKYEDFENKYKTEKIEGLIHFLKEPIGDKKPRVTKDKRVIDKFINFFENKK